MDNELLNIIKNFNNLGNTFIVGKRNTLKTFEYKGIIINIKSFRVPFLINGLIYKFFRKSKAKRSFENAKILITKKINTPKPIAFYEIYLGIFLAESYYISEQLDADFIFRDIFGNEADFEIEKILKGIAKLTFELHQNGIEFLDHSPGNTLIKKDLDGNYKFYIVDLNRMRFHAKMSFKMRMNNLKKITPSEEMIKIIAKEYAILYNENEVTVFNCLWKLTADFQKKSIRKQNLKIK